MRRWLQTSGFGQYADLFDAHGTDARALTALTDQHLRDLGIPLGPRLNLLATWPGLPLQPSLRWPNVAG